MPYPMMEHPRPTPRPSPVPPKPRPSPPGTPPTQPLPKPSILKYSWPGHDLLRSLKRRIDRREPPSPENA